jgi:hypothetical protein
VALGRTVPGGDWIGKQTRMRQQKFNTALKTEITKLLEGMLFGLTEGMLFGELTDVVGG